MAEQLNSNKKKVVIIEASYIHEPVVGQCVVFCNSQTCQVVKTSKVVDIIRNDKAHCCVMFETQNSIYQITYRLCL